MLIKLWCLEQPILEIVLSDLRYLRSSTQASAAVNHVTVREGPRYPEQSQGRRRHPYPHKDYLNQDEIGEYCQPRNSGL